MNRLPKLRTFIMLAVMLTAKPLFALTLNAEDVIPHTINELPYYGGGQKAPKMLQADEDFKKAVIEKAGTAEKASDIFAKGAWTLFQGNKLNMAMRRANEAWLLDDKNYQAYWVMALIQCFRSAPREETDALFKNALMRVAETDRTRLNHDYQVFQSGTANLADNAQQISAQYLQARKTMTGK